MGHIEGLDDLLPVDSLDKRENFIFYQLKHFLRINVLKFVPALVLFVWRKERILQATVTQQRLIFALHLKFIQTTDKQHTGGLVHLRLWHGLVHGRERTSAPRLCER